MKTKIIALILASLAFATAAEKIKAPNGGRIIAKVEPHAEFLLTNDEKIEIRFLDAAGKVIAPTSQVVSVTMGDRTAPTKLTFTQDGDKLISDKTVVKGDNLPVVLQIKTTAEAKAITIKFNLNRSTCPECKLTEYACDCDHAKRDDGHDHKSGVNHKH